MGLESRFRGYSAGCTASITFASGAIKTEEEVKAHYRFWSSVYIPCAIVVVLISDIITLADDYHKMGTGQLAVVQQEGAPFVKVLSVSDWVDNYHRDTDASMVKSGYYPFDKLIEGYDGCTWLNASASEDNFDAKSAGKGTFSNAGYLLVQSIGFLFLVFGFFPLLLLCICLYFLNRVLWRR